MEVQPIVKHKPADKGMKWKSQSMDEVGKEYDPLMEFRSRNDLPCVREPMRDVCGQVSDCSKLRNVLHRAIHLPPSPDMFGCTEKVRTGALQLERARMDERRRK